MKPAMVWPVLLIGIISAKVPAVSCFLMKRKLAHAATPVVTISSSVMTRGTQYHPGAERSRSHVPMP